MDELINERATVLRQLLERARDANNHLNLNDPADYWYRLGQRNADIYAAVLIALRGNVEDAKTVADRIIEAFSRRGSSMDEHIGVASAATHRQSRSSMALTPLQWLGRKAFQAVHGDPYAIDIPYGSAWGDERETSITLRCRPGERTGLLFAHNATWDEYTVLASNIAESDVEATCTAAYRTGGRVTIEHFAAQLRSHRHVTHGMLDPGPEAAR